MSSASADGGYRVLCRALTLRKVGEGVRSIITPHNSAFLRISLHLPSLRGSNTCRTWCRGQGVQYSALLRISLHYTAFTTWNAL